MAKDHKGVLNTKSVRTEPAWHLSVSEAYENSVGEQVMHYQINGEIELCNVAEFEDDVCTSNSYSDVLDHLREVASAEIRFRLGPPQVSKGRRD